MKTLIETKCTADNITKAQIIAIRDNGRMWVGKAALCSKALRGDRNARDRIANLVNAHAAVAAGTY